MKNLLITINLIIALGILTLRSAAAEPILVVVNKNNPLVTLPRQAVTDIFMGRTEYFPDGMPIFRVDASANSKVRAEFYRRLVNMSTSEVNAYWARLTFTGRATPPMQVRSDMDVTKLVEMNPSAIGYIRKGDMNEQLKTIFIMEAGQPTP